MRATRWLLDQREQKKWDSFSWLAARPLIASLNDLVNKGAPRLVHDLRTDWTTQQADSRPGCWNENLIVQSPKTATRRESSGPGDSRFILLGDPGEQDASQYVVVPALLEHVDDVDFMMICSDVIYPTGDINDYADGFYIPYGEVPAPPYDLPQLAKLDRLRRLPVYALPGNHDWYDGLTGFMWHFCGAEALDPMVYGPSGGSLLEWPARLLWRRPSRRMRRLHLEDKRSHRAAIGQPWEPRQPGPYFVVDTGHVVLVCIDTGIDGTIDRQQGEWLVKVSSGPKPKLLLTGKPLLVNRKDDPCEIVGGPVHAGDDRKAFDNVYEVVTHKPYRYVATIGGDIHNFQHYTREGIQYIVSGGGGAYMKATHTIPGVGKDQPDPPEDELKKLIPAPTDSLRYFARQLLPRLWHLLREIFTVIGGIGLGALLVNTIGGQRQHVLTACSVALGICWLTRALVLTPSFTQTSWYRLLAAIVAALAGVVLAMAGWWLAPTQYATNVWAWLWLTAGSCGISWLMRETGWWRSRTPEVRDNPSWLLPLAGLLIALPVAVFVASRDWVLTVSAVMVAAAAFGGWFLRDRSQETQGWRSWNRWAPIIAYIVQTLAALLVLQALVVPPEHRDVLWMSTLGAVACLLLLGIGAVIVWCLVMIPIAAVDGLGQAQGLRAGWGRVGPIAPPVLLLIVGVALWGSWDLFDLSEPDADARRGAFTTVLMAVSLVVIPLLLDGVRRACGRNRYKAVLILIAVFAIGVLGWSGVLESSAPKTAAVGLVVLSATAFSVVIAHLTFLGAFWLVRDRDHEGEPNQFTEAEAQQVIDWRHGGERPTSAAVARRAMIVFPGLFHPHGPLQNAVSEIFDSDKPPFYKNFLVLDSRADLLTITTYLVTGLEASVNAWSIEIPLHSG
jgi:Calcineurin-like phosphoesterase